MSFSVKYPEKPIKSGDIFRLIIVGELDTLEYHDTEGMLSVKPKTMVFPPGGPKTFICKSFYPMKTKVTMRDPKTGYVVTFNIEIIP